MAETNKPPDIERRVYLERVRIFHEHASGGTIRVVLALFFAGLSLRYAHVPVSGMGLWIAACVLDVAAMGAVEAMSRRQPLTAENARLWVNIRLGLIMATGLLLGGSPFLLPATGSEIAELMIFVIMVTGVSVTCIGYTTMPPYFLSLTLPGMALLILSFLRAGDTIHYTFAVMAMIVEVVLLRKALDVSRTAVEGIRINEQLKIEIEKRQDAERDARFALDVAQRANNAKSNFLANMSHELRTPMNAITGFAGALRAEIAGPLNDKQAEYVQDIENSSIHLLSLVNDLLDLSKIEAGKLNLAPELLDLGKQIQGCLPMVSDQALKGGITIKLDVPANLPALHADPRLFNQMLVNLLSNSVKFTDPGGQVTVAAGVLNGGNLAVSVMDDGAGMTAEEISVAVQPFEQTELGQTKEGTGLGLPLVKRMAELHGGDLSIESAAGEGTTATISFPPHRTVRQRAAV